MVHRQRIDTRLVGDVVQAGQRTLQPVARLTGWCQSGGHGVAARIRLEPVEAIVYEPAGHVHSVALHDPAHAVRRSLLLVAVAAPLLCRWVVWAATRLRRI